jgi:SNF2 family DNA or RNA helicase
MEHFKYRFNLLLKTSGYSYQKHQEDGMLWCVAQEYNKPDYQGKYGGIIADEMGCGKTFMTISLIACNLLPKTLIVLPRQLIDQWKTSIFKITGHTPFVYYNNKNEELLHDATIVITTYGVISHKYKNNNNSIINSIQWDRIIYDEAHHMKSNNTLKHISGNKLQSNIKWLITGTPIQNDINDLYTLMSLLDVKKPRNIPISELKKSIIKRTKESVNIHLPPVITTETEVSWNNAEEKIVSKILHKCTNPNLYDSSSIKYSCLTDDKVCTRIIPECMDEPVDIFKPIQQEIADDKCSKKTFTNEYVTSFENITEIETKLKNYIIKILGSYYLTYYLRCKQACISTQLLHKLQDNITKCELHDTTLISKAFNNSNNKINTLVQKLKERNNNCNNKIIFCNFRNEMDMIQQQLYDNGIYDVEIYDGRITQKQRINILQNKPNILIIQIQMGCEGLNLQYANEIYFVGPLWNPAAEQQAIGRCYRLGQTKPTYVFKFYMENINEEQSMDYYILDKVVSKMEAQKIIS